MGTASASNLKSRLPTIYNTDFLKSLLPNVEQNINKMSVAELDHQVGIVDRSIRRITNSMRTVRAEISAQSECRELAPQCRFHLGSIFALTGLHSVLEENMFFRARLIYARSRAPG